MKHTTEERSRFKDRMLEAVDRLREQYTVKELALELYEVYGLECPLQSWISRVGACFNPNKPEFFDWCDIVVLVRFTGQTAPIEAMCDELGFERPKALTHDQQIRRRIVRVRAIKRELEREEGILQAVTAEETVGARFARHH